jgi:hypothetical protein
MKQVERSASTNRRSGLVIMDGARIYSAKEVLRVAYRLANRLRDDSVVKFSSGDGTLNVLKKLGFEARRIAAERPVPGEKSGTRSP